jgi:hypothetical protein
MNSANEYELNEFRFKMKAQEGENVAFSIVIIDLNQECCLLSVIRSIPELQDNPPSFLGCTPTL